MPTYKIVDLRHGLIDADAKIVEGVSTPEIAAETALGLHLVRSGAQKDLVARVYWQTPGSPTNMVRLYSKVESDRRR